MVRVWVAAHRDDGDGDRIDSGGWGAAAGGVHPSHPAAAAAVACGCAGRAGERGGRVGARDQILLRCSMGRVQRHQQQDGRGERVMGVGYVFTEPC